MVFWNHDVVAAANVLGRIEMRTMPPPMRDGRFDKYVCRVCGCVLDAPPWGDDGSTASFDICPCCGVEFGYEATTLAGIGEFRREWLAGGAKWFSPK